MRYQAISLDAGYTLIEPVRDGDQHVADLLRGLGHPVSDEAVRDAERVANGFFFERYFTAGDDTWSADRDIHRLWLRYYQIMLGELGVADDDALLAERIIADYNDPANWRLYPEVAATLDELKRRGYRLGVVSDWNSRLLDIFRHLGIIGHLDWVLASGQIGYAKPQAALYRLAAQRANSSPQAMLHVGDSYYADVRGARAAGMDAVLLDRHHHHPPADCPIIHDLSQLLSLI